MTALKRDIKATFRAGHGLEGGTYFVLSKCCSTLDRSLSSPKWSCTRREARLTEARLWPALTLKDQARGQDLIVMFGTGATLRDPVDVDTRPTIVPLQSSKKQSPQRPSIRSGTVEVVVTMR